MKARGETLSQSEIEALLASIPIEGGAAPAAPSAQPKEPRRWDFRKPDKFSKDHLRSLLALHQTFARGAATALAGRLRCSVTFRVTSVDQGLYEEYLELLPEQSVVNVISMKPLDGHILLEFHAGLAMVMIDRLLGGSGGPIDATRALTDIELPLIRSLVRIVLEARMGRLSAEVGVASNRRHPVRRETQARVLGRLAPAPLKVTAIVGET